MSLIVRIFIFLIFISFASCTGKKTCSGLSPEVGSYNTAKKIRKARRHAHSAPEKAAETHRIKVAKNQKSNKLMKTTGKQGGLFHMGSKKKGNNKKKGKTSKDKKDGKLHLDKKS